MVHRLAGVHVGAHHEEVHGVFPVGLLVKGVQAVGNLPIAEVRPEEVPGGHQGAEALYRGSLQNRRLYRNTRPGWLDL